MPYIGQGLEQGRRQLYTFTATASQTTFSASYTPGFVDVYQNGILLTPDDYTATNGTSIVLGAGAAVSDEITIIAQHTFTLADVVSSSSGGTFTGDVTMAGNLTVQGTTITVDTNTAQTLALGDADKIKLGDDGDLEIYHSGADSFIDDTGTGSIFIRSGTTYLQNAAGTKTSIQTNAGAGQTLYYNNTSKFQTTDNGALVGDGLGTEVLTILADSSGESQLRFADGTTGTAAYQGRVEYEHTAGKLNLGAGGVTQVTIDSSGNMGLGTNSPTPTASNYDSASFHISQVGSSSVGAQIRFSTGATGHTASDGTFMAQWADSNFYITNQEANADIRFNAGGNSDMVVFDGQNGGVGINFSDPASTGAKLAVMGIAGSNAIFVKGNAGSGTSWGMGINAGSTSADASFRVYDKDGSNSYLYVRGDGNVGIGTESPAGIHSLAKVLEISGGDGGDLIIGNNASSNIGAGAHIGAIAFKNIDSSTGSAPHYAGIVSRATDTSGNMDLRFYTGTTNLETDTPSLYINSSNNVSIGGHSTDYKLRVRGAASSGGKVLIQTDGAFAGTDEAMLDFRHYDDSGNPSGRISLTGTSNYTGDMIFKVRTGGTSGAGGAGLTRVMTLISAGSGRAVFSPTGTADGQGVTTYANGANGHYVSCTGTSNYWITNHGVSSATGTLSTFYNNSTYCGGIVVTSTNVTQYQSASDYRLKENVVPMTGATERLKQLNPVTFDWINSGESSEGFLAHEVGEIVPISTSGTKDEVYDEAGSDDNPNVNVGDPKYQSVDPAKLVPLLVKTIQELEARITQLESA
tara:strand:- start:525 stop:2936 length:2412 start_codon:yes stop_codon:yes gene_type:complete